jgi:hypothetical protein
MRLKNLSRWKLNPSLDGLLFYAQRMDELLFDYTLDTYKPSALNAPSLCIEALNLIAGIENELIDKAALPYVLDELEWSIQHDPIAKGLLEASLDYYVLRAEETKLSEVRLRLEVLSRTLEAFRYLKATFVALRDHVAKGEKAAIDRCARNAITTLTNIGVSKQHLFNLTNDFFFNPVGLDIESPTVIDQFLDEITPKSHEFEVYFIVSSLIRQVSTSIKAFRLQVLDQLPEEVAKVAAASNFAKNDDEVFVCATKLRSYDRYSAREKAIRNLDALSDLFTLFYHKTQIAWRPMVLVNQCCRPGTVAVLPPKGPMEKAFDLKPEKASKELNRLLQDFSARGASFNKFNRVADLHGICVSHDIPENQLVSIWTSLETLIPSHLGSSKISNVVSAMLPFLVSPYTKRLVERLTSDLVIWDHHRVKKILNKVPCPKGSTLQERTANLLAVKENDGIRNELYEHLKDFHLLRYRVFRLSETMTEPAKIRELLELHERKVMWQIRRIYRTRNLIVHSGTVPSYVPTLIENGHDYLDQVLFDVMQMSCGEYRVKSIDQAFELAKIRYLKFKKQLADVEQFDQSNAGFLVGN